MKKIFIISFGLLLQLASFSQTNPPELLLRLDDNGMNHSVTKAIEEVAKTGIPFSTSVLFVCPWYQEAVAILKQYPNVSVGVHLALNSEWKFYRWGPVLGAAVPSLIDSNGYFYSSGEAFLKCGYKLDEVEKELDAQMQRAMRSGLKIDYIDYHMGTAIATPQLKAIVDKLAKKYHVGLSGFLGEIYMSPFDIAPEKKQEQLLKWLPTLSTTKPTVMVMHVAQATPEMNALVDMNNTGQHSDSLPIVAMNRAAELASLLSKEFQGEVKAKEVKLITYGDLMKRQNKAF